MTTTTIPTDPTELEAYLEYAEVDASRDPDCRRMLRQERFALRAALQSGDASKIDSARNEALRVARMWEGY